MQEMRESVQSDERELSRRRFVAFAAATAAFAALGLTGCAGGGTGESVSTQALPLVDNIESLRDFSAAQEGTTVRVLGFADKGDGGEGVFVFSPITPLLGALDDDVGFVIHSRVPALRAGRWVRTPNAPVVSALWFGARGDGNTSNQKALGAAADTSASLKERLEIPAGVYDVSGLASHISLIDLTFYNMGKPAVLIDRVPQTQTIVHYFADA